MKLSVPVAAFRAALAAAVRVVEKRHTIPILANVRLFAEGDSLKLVATDLDIEIRAAVPAEIELIGGTTLPAGMLLDIVKKLDGDQRLSLQPGESGLYRLSAGRSKWNLQGLPESDFPDLAAGTFTHQFELRAAEIDDMVSKVSFAISTEETRYYLNGIYLHAAGDRLRAVTTDGHRLARLALPLPVGAADMPGIIVPRKAVAELGKLAEAAVKDEAGATARVEISENKIRVAFGETVLTSKLIDGTYPDYQRVIPAEAAGTVTLPREIFRDAVDRVTTVATDRGRAIKLEFGGDIIGETLRFACASPDAGSAEEEIGGLSTDGAVPDQIGFNSRYVLDCLSSLPPGNVVLGLNEAGSPARLHAPDKADDFLVVLMPMRV